ncbi:MAG: SHOCT domain-containing protein [Actinobacteria bacterium]|nr:MAG: SHOCT domain-containing protein [Actinomycetota bacterium]
MMGGPGYGYGYGMSGGGWLGGLLMWGFGLLVLIGLVLLVIWAVRASSGHGHTASGGPGITGPVGHDEAVTIARRRLANGEITAEEYADIMRALGS